MRVPSNDVFGSSPRDSISRSKELAASKQADLDAAALRRAIELATDIVLFATSRNLKIVDMNNSARVVLGYSRDELVQMTFGDICPELVTSVRTIWSHLRQDGDYKLVARLKTKDGEQLTAETKFSHSKSDRHEEVVIVAREFANDASGNHANELYRDYLTGLADRMLLEQRLQLVHGRAREAGRAFAVLFVDLDNFKSINDAHGHLVGDHVLQVIAKRLVRCVRPTDCVARFGGDEFVVILEDVEESEAVIIAERMRHAVRAPIEFRGVRLVAMASVGVALDLGQRSPERVLHEADVAMYRAKQCRSGVVPARRNRAAGMTARVKTTAKENSPQG